MRTGRPKKPTEELRSYRVEIKMNERENNLLNELCKKCGMEKTKVLIMGLDVLEKKIRRKERRDRKKKENH